MARHGASSLIIAWSAIAVSACAASAQGEGPESGYDGVVRESLYVPVRDGTELAVNIYRPASGGEPSSQAYPVVFAFTPYRARFEQDGEVVELGLSERLGLAGLPAHGYVVATADIRGKGASFGARRGFQDRTEAMDGHDLVEWLAAQPWSTGDVGMAGCSYLGGTAVQTATTAPPSLRAVFAGATDFDKYSFIRRGGITAQFNTRPDEPLSHDLASVPVDGDEDRSRLEAAVAEHAGNTPMAPLWYGMPFRDSVSEFTGNAFWEEVGPHTYLEALQQSDIAFYFWVTWKDEPAEQVLLAAENLPARVLIGPGTHCEPPPGVDLGVEMRRFFDARLKGVDTGVDDEPLYRWWTLDAAEGEEWTYSDVAPGAGIDRTEFFFGPGPAGSIQSVNDGVLGLGGAGDGEDSFQVDFDVAGEEYFPFWPAVLDEKGLTYTSPPLAEDVEMTGHPVIHLTVAADQPDANVFAYLLEVDDQGQAENVSFGRLALSHRSTSDAPYETGGLPWRSGREADVADAVPGEFYEVSFALTPMSKVFRAGSRIRVAVRGADPRQRNIEDIAADPAPGITLSLGQGGSRIEAPFVQRPRFQD